MILTDKELIAALRVLAFSLRDDLPGDPLKYEVLNRLIGMLADKWVEIKAKEEAPVEEKEGD